MLTAGDRIGDWIVDRPLGEGGMGAVFRVHSALSERVEAALKIMKPSQEPDARARFVREAEALSALRHPAIIRVMGFSEEPRRGLLYLVMELAEGETLKRRLERGPMALPEALATFVPLAAGLEHAHAAGISHRDIKPSNVILTPDGVRLVDFGIAAAAQSADLTGAGHLGTLSYLPPEVFRGEKAEPPSIDIYGLGLLLHEALTGVHPFPVEPGLTPAAAAATVGMRKLQQAALDPGAEFPDAVRDLVRRTTDPSPAVRPDMAEIRRVLASLVERRSRGGPAPATGPVSPTRVPAWTPPADATERVPDPVMPVRSFDRSTAHTPERRRERRRSVIVAWVASVAAAALFAALVFVMIRGASREPAGAPEAVSLVPAPRPSASPRHGRAVVPATLPSIEPSAAPPASPPSPSPSARPSATPRPSPSPTATPRPSPSPSPSARPSPSPSPSVRPSPSPSVRPSASSSDTPSLLVSPAGGADDSSTLTGDWLLSNRVDSTDYPAYQGMRLGYILTLRQDGYRITGSGEKTSENGAPLPPGQRSPIAVTGRVDNGVVTLQFAERGAQRSSSGTFRWQLSPDHSRLSGSFASDAASSRGASSAQRVR